MNQQLPLVDAPPNDPFAQRMRVLRTRFVGKQLCLAMALGRTDAAVSMWESGKRLPTSKTLRSILEFLAESGAPAQHLADLSASWDESRRGGMAMRRRAHRRHRPAFAPRSACGGPGPSEA